MPISDAERKLRTVRYLRHPGPGHGPQLYENSLLAFLYDCPSFGACGVFPPFHLLNQYLLRGGSQGGMSPGATWEPFSITPAEYRDLTEAVRAVPPESLRDRARYAHLPFSFDPEFDGDPSSYPIYPGRKIPRSLPPGFEEYFRWVNAVCAKHRDRRKAELRRAGFMK